MKPATRCLLCEKPFTPASGHRIVGAPRFFYAVTNLKDKRPGTQLKRKTATTTIDGRELLLTLGGDIWTDNSLLLALADLNANLVSWVCQPCADWGLCRICNSPLIKAPGSDVISEAGCITHHAIFGVQYPCTNPDCEKYKPWDK